MATPSNVNKTPDREMETTLMLRANNRRTHTPNPPSGGNYRQQLRAYALAYSENGWPIFPLRPGSKRPARPGHTAAKCTATDPRCTTPAGHQGWEQRATTDPDRIKRAWADTPWGIGIACGPAGLVVVDLDIPKHAGVTGAETLRQLETDHGHQLPATFTVATPSGGRHLYYHRPHDAVISNSAGTVGVGIDIRSTGGYVAAPPTTIPTGTYHIIDHTQPAILPNWFSQLLNPPPPTNTPAKPSPPPNQPGPGRCNELRLERYTQAAVEGELARINQAVEGQRNHTLFTASIAIGQLVAAQALPQHQAEQLLTTAAQTHVAAGAYTANQAQQTITSGLGKGLKEPRQLPTQTTRPEPVGANQ